MPPSGEALITPARGGKLTVDRVTVELPPGVTDRAAPLSVKLTVRDRLPESRYRRLYAVFDAEATEAARPLRGKQAARRVTTFRRPVTLEVDLTGIASVRPMAILAWDQRLGHWWRLPTTIDRGRNVAMARTRHFSSFGLGEDTDTPTPPQTLESFQTAQFTGTASATFNIDVPPGTAGMAPRIPLSYSGQTPDDMNETWALADPQGDGDNAETALQAGPVGLGWNLELGAIFGRDDNTYRILLEGGSYELVLVDGSNASDKRYRTREDQFWLIRRIQDTATNAQNTTGTYWLVRTKNGTEYRFGHSTSSDVVAQDAQGNDIAWASLLDRVKDSHGNYTEYDYYKQSDAYGGHTYDQAYYPSEIRYTKNDGQSQSAQRKVVFNLVDRTDYVTKTGQYQYYFKKKIDSIDVFLDNALVRKYVFKHEYKQPYWNNADDDNIDPPFQQTQGASKLVLTAIYVGDGSCATGPVYGSVDTTHYLPPVRFSYYEGTNAYNLDLFVSSPGGRLHLHTMNNDLLGGWTEYQMGWFSMQASGSAPLLKNRLRVIKQVKGAAGGSIVQSDYTYGPGWWDGSASEYRGHEAVAAQDSAGYQHATSYYTSRSANGKSLDDCNFLRGKAYREVSRSTQTQATVSSYGSDLGATNYARGGGWNATPAKFSVGASGELRIGLLQNTSYSLYDHTGKAYFAPSGTVITKVEFDWETNYSNWDVLLSVDCPDHPDYWTADADGHNSGTGRTVEFPSGVPWVAFGLFIQDNFTYTSADGAWYGRIYNLKVYYRSTLKSRDSAWEYATSVSPAKHIRLTQADETLDGQPKRLRYAYDSYGNVTDTYDDGNPNVSGDERRRSKSYVVNTGVDAWIVDRVNEESVFGVESSTEVEKARTSYYYDRDSNGNRRTHGSAPTKGELAAVERVDLANWNNDAFTDYWYDAYGNLIKEQDPLGNQTTATYESTYHSFLSTITNAKNQVESRTYDAATGKPLAVTDINNQATSYEYDAFKRLSKLRRPGDGTGTGTLEFVYTVTYDSGIQAPRRFAITTRRKDGSSGDGVLVSKAWYDGLGRVVQARSENVSGRNQLVADTAFDGRGLVASQSTPYESATDTWDYTTPATQPKTQYAYDGLRRTAQVTAPDGTLSRKFYAGRTVTVVDENGHQRLLTNDPFDRLIEVKEYTGTYGNNPQVYATTAYAYNALDLLTQITDTAGNLSKMEYNSLGRRTKYHDPDLCGSDPNQASYWRSYIYDLAGNLTSQTDAKGQELRIVYDVLNRPTRKHYPKQWVDDTLTTSHTVGVYDLMEIRAAIDVDRAAAGLNPDAAPWTDGAVVAGKDVTIRAVHFTDMRDRVQDLWTQAGLGTVPGFTRGAIQGGQSRAISLRDPSNLRSWLTPYDPFNDQFANYEGSAWAGQNGRRARAVYRWDDYTDGASRGYPKGRRTEMWDAAGRTRWTYDSRGRMIKEERWIDGHCYITEWSYDAMDRVVTVTYPRTPAEIAGSVTAEVVTNAYNERGLLASMSSSVAGSILSDMAYNPLGLPVQQKLVNDSGQSLYLRQRYHVLDSGSSSYPYGALWDIRLEKGSPASQLLRLQHFYDYARNTTRVVEDSGQDLTYVLDDLDRLTARQLTGGANQETFGYNQVGNMTSKNGVSYTYGSAKPHAVTSDGSQPMEYDTNGNMTRRGSLYLKYDPEDQLVKASSDSAGLSYTCRYAIDGDGRRAKRVDSNGTIHYVGPHYERNVGTGADTTEKVSKYYRAQMGRVSRLVALRRKVSDSYEGLRYIVPDHLGGTIRLVDTAGTTIDDIRYHAFGGTRSGGTAMPTDQLFTGQTMDSSTGLYFYGARYYDPLLGRFLAPDRAGPDLKNPQSLNKYSYVLNNPVRYTDPTGNRPWDGEPEDDGGAGGGGGDDGGGDWGGDDTGGGDGGYSGDGGGYDGSGSGGSQPDADAFGAIGGLDLGGIDPGTGWDAGGPSLDGSPTPVPAPTPGPAGPSLDVQPDGFASSWAPVPVPAPTPSSGSWVDGPDAANAGSRDADWGQIGTGAVMMVVGPPVVVIGAIVVITGFAEAAGCVTPAAPFFAFASIETVAVGGLIATTGAGLFAGGGYLVGHGLGWVQ